MSYYSIYRPHWHKLFTQIKNVINQPLIMKLMVKMQTQLSMHYATLIILIMKPLANIRNRIEAISIHFAISK